LYPPLPLELPSTPPAIPDQDLMDTDTDIPMPGSLSFQPPQTHAASTRLCVPSKPVEPFIFGLPLPQHNVSNAQFKLPVFLTMSKRLQAEGVQGIGMDIISKLQPGAHADGIEPPIGRAKKFVPKVNGMTKKFEGMREQVPEDGVDRWVFEEEGISRKRTMNEIKRIAIAKKRRSSVGHGAGRDRFGRRVGGETPGRLSGKVIPAGKKPRALPGSFDDDEDEDRDGADEKVEEKTADVDSSASGEANKDKEQDEVEKEKEEIGRGRKEKLSNGS
jgi:hypothetical protein